MTTAVSLRDSPRRSPKRGQPIRSLISPSNTNCREILAILEIASTPATPATTSAMDTIARATSPSPRAGGVDPMHDPEVLKHIVDLFTRQGPGISKFAREAFKARQSAVDEDLLSSVGTVLACTWCRAYSKMRLCSKCKSSSYCSPECQRADWPKHKKICSAVSRSSNIFQKKTDILSARAFVIPNLARFFMILCHIALALGAHPDNVKTQTCVATWDLVPVLTPPEYYHKKGAKERKNESGEQRYMLKLVSFEAVPNRTIGKKILEARQLHPLEDTEKESRAANDIVIAACLSKSARRDGKKAENVFWTNVPVLKNIESGLMNTPPMEVLRLLRGNDVKEQIMKALNEGIILDTKNDWRLRTYLKEDD